MKEIMTHEVRTIPPETSVEETLKIMFRSKHMGYPVMDAENILGIITFHDISRARKGDDKKPVTEFMTHNLIITSPEEPLNDALAKLSQANVGRLPVVENNQLVGIISRTDIMRAMEILKLKK